MMRAVSRTLTSVVTSGLSWVKRSSRIMNPPIAQLQRTTLVINGRFQIGQRGAKSAPFDPLMAAGQGAGPTRVELMVASSM
jgi:hypothetical protein